MENESNSLLVILLPSCRNLSPHRTVTGAHSLCREQERDLQNKMYATAYSQNHLTVYDLWLVKQLDLFSLIKLAVHWLGEEKLVGIF